MRLPKQTFLVSTVSILSTFTILIVLSCNPIPKSTGGSLKDYENALHKAKETKGLVLVDFYAEY